MRMEQYLHAGSGHACVSGCASTECKWSCKLTHDHISHISPLMHGRAAAHESTFLRDTETPSEGFLVCSRVDETVLLYSGSSLYAHTSADGYC